MPKVNIAFNLPEEQDKLELYNNAAKLQSIVYVFTNELRSKIKYGDGKKKHWQEISDLWWQILKEENYDPYAD